MNRIKTLALIIAYVFVCGCASRANVKYVPVKDDAPSVVRDGFARRLAGKFEITASAVFGYKWIKMSALGAVVVDEAKKRFDVVGFNPAGLKIADIHYRDGKVTGDFMFKKLAPAGVNVPEVIAKDLKRIYFKRVPSFEATVRKEKYRIIFSEPFEEGTLDYIFAGVDDNMVEKRFYRGHKLIWQVSYENYQTLQGKIYPATITLRNHQYQYKITAKVKEAK